MQFKPALFLIASALAASSAFATPIAQWDFNNSSTKHTFSMNGASFATLGNISTAFVTGSGSTDKGSPNNALNTLTYGTATTGNMTRGVQFMIDTSGYQDLIFSFDQRNSGTASAWTALLYTLDDGETWTKAQQFQMTGTNFVNNRGFSFADIDGADNNPFFGIQLVAMFAPGTSNYVGTSGTYGSGGTIRYDMVTLSGTEIPEVIIDVPEPGSLALLMAGLGGIGVVSRRRRSN
ncbi:PEP-CTERM sorting domain-containing protein [Pelomonas sp. V22]|uniref:PEP-CTERM sorting domain-containing protein n=1 Tax=Pelomonas sp. V22 TaxID=2822139 RepID=UPI0024A8F54E|nr:PEP-CTERM sorting domain-containing protein [Pelomonas sp. V22]MDI4632735.1 PEP-CTERM sorting domain-containing protein [Pelomonas sp. V22]